MDPLFYFSLAFVGYTYFGYPAVLWILSRLFPGPQHGRRFDPPRVTVLIAAHNEERDIAATLQSVLDSRYPAGRLSIVVVSDASTDETDAVVASFPQDRVDLVRLPRRAGKTAALKAGAPQAAGDILVSIDVGSILSPEAIERLARHFSDESVGSCVGVKSIVKTGGSVSKGDGLYWKYDSWLRHLESQTGSSLSGCEGGLFAIRRELFHVDFPPRIAEDYALCCRLVERGYRNLYEPTAVAYEHASTSMGIEFTRKIRVIVRGILGFWAFRHLLNPFRHPNFFFQNVSHRLCRWLVPFILLLMFLTGWFSDNPVISGLFIGQCVFYMLAAVGFLRDENVSRFVSIPNYFVTVNGAALAAWALLTRPFDVWRPTARERASRAPVEEGIAHDEGARRDWSSFETEKFQERRKNPREGFYPLKERYLVLKRFIDIVVSLAALVTLSPLFLLIGVLIVLNSPGWPIYRQRRRGKDGRMFWIYKFRTMRRNSHRVRDRLFDKNEMDGIIFKLKNDPRITMVGAYLRRTSLDELPQLINILLGDMSFVGPRPFSVEVFDRQGAFSGYEAWIRGRHRVRPGLTGLWQINGRNDLPFEELIRHDLDYLRICGGWADLSIVFKTLPAVLKKQGAY